MPNDPLTPRSTDRRRRPTAPWDALFHGRRRGPRRADERARPYFADRYPARSLALAGLVLFLSVFDALATLALLADGRCEEANPAMQALLDLGPAAFIAGKLALTAACLGIVVVAQFQQLFVPRLRAGRVLTAAAVVYGALVVYQSGLLIAL